MAAEVEVQSGEVGRSGGRLHLTPLMDSNNKNRLDLSPMNQSHFISPEPSKPVPGPKPRLTPKPFTVDRNPTIKPILAPKPQPKPRPESTRIAVYKPDLPISPKPQTPPPTSKPRSASTNSTRPASTTFKGSKLNTGQTTKPVAQPFKPAPPIADDPNGPISPSLKPSDLTYSRSLKRPPSGEWSGSTKKEDLVLPNKVGTSITRAKSMGHLLQIGQEEKVKTKSEAAVSLRSQPRGIRQRPVSAIFPTSPTKAESPTSPFPRSERRPLSADLTSKFESVGLSFCCKNENGVDESLQKKGQEKTVKTTLQNTNTTKQDQSKDSVLSKDSEDMHGASIKSRISLLLDSSSPASPVTGQAPETPTQTAPEAEPAVGVKQLIKQLTVDQTTPNQSPVLKPVLKPRPLPLDLTKRFLPDPAVSLSDTTDRHDSGKALQKRVDDPTRTPSDEKTFVDLKDAQDPIKTPVSEVLDMMLSPKESEALTVRASVFENVIEKHNVLVVDEDKTEKTILDKRDEEGKLVTATYKEPVPPSGPVRVVHAFDTVPATEGSTVSSENIPPAQWEDKAMTLRSRRSEGTKTTQDKSGTEQISTTPRYLRVGALPKWNLDEDIDMETGMPKDKPRDFEVEDASAAAAKRLKTQQTEEQAKPRATYFALTGQMHETVTATSDTAENVPFSDPSALWSSQGKSFKRNPSLDAAVGKTLESNEDNITSKSIIETQREKQKILEMERLAELEYSRLKEREMQREYEKQRQKAREKQEFEEKQRALEIHKQIELEKQKHLEFEKQRQLEAKRQRKLEIERQKQLEVDRQRQNELEWQKQIEDEKQRHAELERLRQIELEKQRQIELEKQKQLELKKQKQELERQKQLELENQRQMEIQKQRQLEAEKQRQMELEKQRQQELEWQRQMELDRQRQMEIERQEQIELEKRQMELERQKQIEAERQRQKEIERQRQIELEKQRQIELERQKLQEIERERQLELENERQRQLERERRELERQRQLEEERRQKELDRERKLMEKQKERQRMQAEAEEQERRRQFELQKQRERQQVLELEKQRLREKMEKEQAEKLKQMALEHEMLRLREVEKERERQKEVEREKEREQQREQELQRQRELEKQRQKQLDMERQELEKQRIRQQEQEKERQRREELERIKELERRQLQEFELQKQAERQLIVEQEKHRIKEKMEREEVERMRQVAKQQEAERQRLKEKQKREEQERIRLESAALRPKVVDIDSVLKNEQSKSSPRGDPSTRWKEPSPKTEQNLRPGSLDINSFITQSQSSPSRDLFPVVGIQEVNPRVPMSPQNTGGLQSPVWTTSQNPWEMHSVEMSVDKPEQPKKHSSKTSLEQLLLRQEERRQASPRRWSGLVVDDPFQMGQFSAPETKPAASVPAPVSTPAVSSSSPSEQLWLPIDTPTGQSRAEGPSQRRTLGSTELNRIRSRSMSRRSAPSTSAVESSLFRMRSRSAHRDQARDGLVQQKHNASTDDESKDPETPVHETDSQYGTWETGLRSEDSLTPATPSSESNLSPSAIKLTSPQTPPHLESDAIDGITASSELLPFPDAPVSLLDNSAQRSRAQLGKKRAPRTRPSRAVKPPQAEGGASDDWIYKDSTEEKVESKKEDSDSEEEPKGPDAGPTAASSQPQRVALFPGMDQSALMAQLKKRGESDNQTDGSSPAPSQLSRSPKSPFLPRATRVLPPAGAKENGVEDSPQWLKELKSKKRLSQYETES